MKKSEQPSAPNVDDLVEKLRARVEERRRSGYYPPGLEEDLAQHFQRIAAHSSRSAAVLGEQLADVYATMGFDARRIPFESRVWGGKIIHRLISRLVARQTQGILEQTTRFAHAVYAALDAEATIRADFVGQIDAINERLAAYERAPDDSPVALRDLRRRVEQLEAAEARGKFVPLFTNEAFESTFRGSREQLLDRYRDLAFRLRGCSPALDIGCGRGEFLELLGDLDIEASGVEIDDELVKAASERGLAVERADGLRYLASLADGSLGGLVLIQVVEHWTAQEIVNLVALAADKLRSEGKVIIETINPQSLYVFAHALYADPTHMSPVHPAYLTFLFREAGFQSIEIEWRSPPPPDEVLEEAAGSDRLSAVFNANVHRLNRLLFAPQDYALIATR